MPSASLVALATVVHAIGLPIEALAIITGVDIFMDMGRTATNVYGNTIATVIVTKLGGFATSDPAAEPVPSYTGEPLLNAV